MNFIHGVSAVVALALSAAPAVAGGVPAQAMNKTITIAFAAGGMAKSPDGQTRGFSTRVSRVIYVSSAGRLFMRQSSSSGRSTRSGDFDPNDSQRGRGGSFSFQGAKLVGVIPYATGARQITATFDPGFSSCTASVIEGGSGGVIRRKGPDGVVHEITGGTTSSPTCSIQSGNAFAQ